LAVEEVGLNGEWKSKSPLKVEKSFRGIYFAKAPDPPKRPILKLEKSDDEIDISFLLYGRIKVWKYWLTKNIID
jgi:hypothetical protein